MEQKSVVENRHFHAGGIGWDAAKLAKIFTAEKSAFGWRQALQGTATAPNALIVPFHLPLPHIGEEVGRIQP